jgi:zinc transporter ZupT
MIEVLAASVLVMLASFSGKFFVWRSATPLVERNLHFLVSFSAGVLLAVMYGLASEIVEHAGSLVAGLPWIAIGAGALLIAFRFLPHFHHHHDSKSNHAHSRIDARRILLSDGIHNIGDGIVIVASFAASPFLGVVTTASILVHECLQEVSEFFVLRESGMPASKALWYNFLASSTILIGTIGGYFLMERFEAMEVPLLGLAAGSYLIVVLHDLVPHSVESVRERGHMLRHVVFFALGLALMLALVVLVPHAE